MTWPATIDTLQNFAHGINNFQTTLTGGISNSSAAIPVLDVSGIPTGLGYYISIGAEIIFCDNRSGNNLQVASGGRGQLGTAAASHASGTEVNIFLVSGHIDQFISRIIALQQEIGKTNAPAVGSVRERLAALEAGGNATSVMVNGATQNIPSNGTETFNFGRNNSNGGFAAWKDGFIIGMTFQTSAASSGQVALRAQVNGVNQPTATQIILNGTVGQNGELVSRRTGALELTGSDRIEIDQGDTIGFQTVSSAWGQTGADSVMTAIIEYT